MRNAIRVIMKDQYIFKRQDYNKPFFSTFAKTSMFILYLVGFLVWKPWRQQCTRGFRGRHAALFADAEGYFTACTTDNSFNNSLSEPLYVPVKFQDVSSEKVGDASGECEESPKKPRVRFSNIMEVRQLPSTHALEAKLSRMSYPAAKDHEDHESVLKTVSKLPVTQVAKISFFFCFVWFLANFSYQEALSDTQVAIVNILSSTSGLFTLILAAVFPSNSGDRFTLSKLLAVALRGCFLTSSLIGTLALSLTIPLSIIADMCMQKVRFSWLFFAGAVPVFLSFFIVTILCHYNNWDPVMVGVRRVFAFICRKHRIQRMCCMVS
ncbi:Solute carrier family 35 member F5 [Acipenser ruthenus]|uniref:Solute carrier family 35 member F5 n=1 Tax=Acipenser ruthenus TaxID=7906 RepID=A0A662YSX3_ACIRT|nr:Solute carrier family 35 member F5 [Acipenser ruthenus]